MTELPTVMRRGRASMHGLHARELTRSGYRHAMRDLYVADWIDPADPEVRLAAAMALATPGTTIGGWAAAMVHEARAREAGDFVRVFDGRSAFDEVPSLTPLLLLADPAARITARPGHRVFRSRVAEDEREPYLSGTITTPTRTAFDLARLSSPGGAVVGLDRLLSLGLVQVQDLQRLVDERPRWRGVTRARRALGLAEDEVRSPMETCMRLEWLAAGLPRPVCNAALEDERGRFLGVVDLLDEATGLVGEYDGEYHASAQQRSSDAARREQLVAAGLTPVTMTAVDQRTAARRAEWRQRLLEQRRTARSRPRRWRRRPLRP